METKTLNQWTPVKVLQDEYLTTWIDAFLIDRKAQRVSPGTIQFYNAKLKLFVDYCDSQMIKVISEITPDVIRLYLLHLEDTNHNPGGIHAAYRSLRAFLKWWEDEVEPDNWKNPINKVKAPKVPIEPIKGVEVDAIQTLINVSSPSDFNEARDLAIFLSLLDTGARAAELLAMNIEDLKQTTGEILIRQGKGHKPRWVFLGKKSRKAVRRYLAERNDDCKALWVTDEGERLSYNGLREIMRRKARKAGIEVPAPHDFRRAFALNMLRNGTDIFSLQRLMGHADISILRRYLAQTDEDVRLAHMKNSPVDNSDL